MQYGGGAMFKPGSYDRYVAFENNPEANFNCIVWPMGLIQVSCNPFREKALPKINLGEIAKEVLAKHQSIFSKILISLDSLKKEFETSQDWKKMQKDEGPDYEGVGFKYSDLSAFYKDCIYKQSEKDLKLYDISTDDKLKEAMNTVYDKMSFEQQNYLKYFKISVWELITRNSGGHPSITNIQGFGFMKYNKDAMSIAYSTDKYTEVMKKIAREFVNNLKEKIDAIKTGKEVSYQTGGVEFTGQDTNESFTYYLVDKSGDNQKVTKDEFIKAGSQKGMKTDKRSGMTIDNNSKKIIAKFENFLNKK